MLEWIAANGGTIAVCLVLVVIVSWIIVSRLKGKKKGNCCSGCKGCPSSGSCYRTDK